MRPVCRWCGLLGFCISTLVHLAIGATFLGRLEARSTDVDNSYQVAVSLAMFDVDPEVERAPPDEAAGKSGPDVSRETETRPVTDPGHVPETAPESVPEPELSPEPELAPAPEPVVGSASPISRNTVPKRKLETKPRTAPKPRRRSRADIKHTEQPRPKATGVAMSEPRQSSRSGGNETEGNRAADPAGVGADGDRKDAARQDALQREYLAGLRRAIAEKRRYPGSARRTGTTGVATVSFVLDRQGHISGARLEKSSGSSTLDRAAMETLQRLARYKPIPEALGRTRWQLRVPIRFALD